MRFYSMLLAALFFLSAGGWDNDFEQAQQRARQEQKLILLNFSGSDWCVPCIRLHKDILQQPAFLQYADTALVLVNADFPRLKKNQLPKEQQKKNDQLADRYNARGSFPLTLLLDAEGKLIHSWEGYPNLTPEAFIAQIKALVDAR